MKKKYQGSSRVKRSQLQALMWDFETLQIKDGESVTDYYAKTIRISNKMRFHGEIMDDTIIVEKILHFYPQSMMMVFAQLKNPRI